MSHAYTGVSEQRPTVQTELVPDLETSLPSRSIRAGAKPLSQLGGPFSFLQAASSFLQAGEP